MQWLRPKPTSQIPEIQSVAECTGLMEQDLVIFFKHSSTCPVSWMAHREVVKFLASEPEAPLYLVPVRQRRDVSQLIAETTGVQHESPQVVVLRRGQVIADASHEEVTAELLTEALSEQAAEQLQKKGPLT